MKIYVVTYGSGGVFAAGADEDALKLKAEEGLRVEASEYEWRPEYGGMERLHYRMADTGRWNKIPARFIQAVEVNVP